MKTLVTIFTLLFSTSTVLADQETTCAKYINNPNSVPVAQKVTLSGKVRLNQMVKGTETDPSLRNIRYVVVIDAATLNRSKAFRSCDIRAVTILNNAAVFTDAMLGQTVSITGILHEAEVSVEEMGNATMHPESVRVLY